MLDSNNLIVYENVNLGDGEPVRRKDSVSLNGVEWSIEKNIKVKDFDQRCFALAHAHMDSIYFAFEEDSQMVAWIQALEDVLIKRDPSAFDVREGKLNHYKTLDLESFIMDDLNTLEVEDLRHAYRHTERTLRTADTDEGTSPMDVLMSIHRAKTAYYSLYQHHFSSMHERRKAKLKYTATIKKRETWEGGSSMGFSIVESPSTGRVMVHSVSPNLVLVSSLEDVEPCDEISTINGEVVSAWPISRIAQFLNAFRVPYGSLVEIEFTRRETPDDEDVDAPYLMGHSLDESPSVYSWLDGCRQYAADAEDSGGGGEAEDEEDADGAPPRKERASFRASVSNFFSRKPGAEGEDSAYGSMNGGGGDPGSPGAAGGDGLPRQRQRPSSMSPRFSLFGGGSRSGKDGPEGNYDDEDGDNSGSPSGADRPRSMPRESSSGRFFNLSGKRGSETAAENAMLQVQVDTLKEEVEILTGQADDHTLKELRLEEEVRDKQRKIGMLEENEQLLCDQIAELSAELQEFKSGAKHQVAVTRVTGLSIEEKVSRLKQRYGISPGPQ